MQKVQTAVANRLTVERDPIPRLRPGKNFLPKALKEVQKLLGHKALKHQANRVMGRNPLNAKRTRQVVSVQTTLLFHARVGGFPG